MNKTLSVLAIIIGILLLGVAVLYWTTPASNLPAFMPGFEAGITTIHFKHGLASAILGVALFVFAWFRSAPKSQA